MNDSDSKATLLITCPDQKGIVAALAQLLYGHGINIISSQQHTDISAKLFFQRIRIDMRQMHTDLVTLKTGLEEVSKRFEMKIRFEEAARKKRMAIFVSKYDHCLYDLLLRHQAGELHSEIPVIVSNHPDLEPVAQHFGIDFRVFSVSKENKKAQEQKELELLKELEIDLVVLARYMQILSTDFVSLFPKKIINIHHSFLPAFIGGKPYHQAYERGVKLIGATAHYATADLDEGPIIEQNVVRCSHRDQVPDLIRKGRDLEKVVLAAAVRAHLQDRVLVYGNKTVVFS